MRRCATLVNEALLVLGGSTIVGVVMVQAVSALTYQNSVDVDFTINPSLSINLSANDLIINDLTPGSSSDSNIITVDVATNAGYGYYSLLPPVLVPLTPTSQILLTVVASSRT